MMNKYMQWLHLSCIICVLISLCFLYCREIPISGKDYSLPVHQILYLDVSLSTDERAAVIGAALEWQISTQGLVQYDIVMQPNPSLKNLHPVIIVSVSPYFPVVMQLDLQAQTTHLGYYYEYGIVPYIALVGSRLTDDNRKIVVMHELGHALGLGHVDDPNTLMYPNVELESNHITQSDLQHFCRIYSCDASKLSDQ